MLAATAAEPGNIWQQGDSLPATQPNNGLPCHATGKSVAYNLAEAGKAIGVNRSTVLRAIRRGTISATRDPTTGGWLIEPAELHRVFPAVAPEAEVATERNEENATELVELRVRLEIAELRIREKAEQIRNLWQRLDTEAEERRRLTALLTDRSASPAVAVAPEPARRQWWPWRRHG